MEPFNNNAAGKRTMKHRIWLGFFALLVMAQTGLAADKEALEQADFVALPGDEVQIRLTFDHAAPNPTAYKIDKPARLVFDFNNTRSALPGKYFSLGSGNARSMTVVDSRDRARVIVNMGELSGYTSKVSGNQLFITIGKAEVSTDNSAVISSTKAPAASVKSIDNVDFRRGEQGDGQVLIDLSQASIPVDVQQQGNKIIARFVGTRLPEKLRRRLDVSDFATPVKAIDSYNDNGTSVMVVEPQGEFEYLAYQTDNKLTISVKPLTKDLKREKAFTYTGEKLSLNFQDIDVRTVLQLIADFTSMNLVASDTVSGRITLRLQNVPWDQALDLILKTKGLDKRTVGNVMLVAPADEIAKREQLELQANAQTEQLAPLHTEFLQVNYAKATDLSVLINGTNSGSTVRMAGISRLLSDRGSVTVDARTNTLILVDTGKKIDEIRDIVAKLDIPVRQVLIESRIVLATTSFNKEVGVNWGILHQQLSGGRQFVASGSQQGLIDLQTAANSGSQAINPITGQFQSTVAANQANMMAVDLGATGQGVSSLAVGLVDINNVLLDLQLSALQSEGRGEIVATPKVMTADKQHARVASGQNVPYLAASSSGATAIVYESAELALDVTPSITPDGRISMDLVLTDNSVGATIPSVGAILNTNELSTHVVVDDGQTVVLGGIYKESKNVSVTKTPFLGDIPYLGRLFSQHLDSSTKDELLIFVTPRLVNDTFASK
jgi:type IV pilus assembly protein PilQ